MGETLTDSEQAEKGAFILEVNNTYNDERTTLYDLSFPWPLINAIKDLNQYCKSESSVNRQLLFSFRLQLLVLSIICILCIVFGLILMHNQDDQKYILCVIFIVQGVCGLFVVLVHSAAIAFE
jgi:hypothetical protein